MKILRGGPRVSRPPLPSSPLPVGARLKWFARAWKGLGSTFSTSVLSSGYTIPLLTTPVAPRGQPEFYGPKRHFSLLDDHVEELLRKKAVTRVFGAEEVRAGFTSPLLLVRKKSGKYRPCLDLRHLNKFVPHQKFKMEGLKQLRDMIQEGDFMTSIDLQDGYLHVPVSPASQKYLQFSWKNRFYRFTCLPFGLCSAPLVFTKLLRPIVQELRAKGVRLMAYLDDIIILSSSYQESVRNTQLVREALERRGWVINLEKSSLTPSQTLEYLGFLLDSVKMQIFTPNEKRKRFRSAAQRMLKKLQKSEAVRLRTFSSLVGKLQSLTPAVPFCRLHLQALVHTVREKLKGNQRKLGLWDTHVLPPPEVKGELEWWIEWLRGWNGNSIIVPATKVDLFSDASDTGYGGCISKRMARGAPTLVQGYWTQSEQLTSINERELIAAERVVKALLHWHGIKGGAVRLFTDSIVTYTYLNNMGGRFTHLREVARRVLAFCEQREVRLVVEHLPGVQNTVADALSRWPLDRSDWSLSPEVFRLVDFRWGPHTIDWFATRHNARLRRFCSWNADERAVYVDALQHIGKRKENGYANPPFSVIGKILQKIQKSGRDLTLIVPAWPSQHWWPLLLHLLSDTPLLLPPIPDLFVPPERVGVNYYQRAPPWGAFACRISGRSYKRRVFRKRLSKLCGIAGPKALIKIMTPYGDAGEFSAGTGVAVYSILQQLVPWLSSRRSGRLLVPPLQ
jgi:hypothetical protein